MNDSSMDLRDELRNYLVWLETSGQAQYLPVPIAAEVPARSRDAVTSREAPVRTPQAGQRSVDPASEDLGKTPVPLQTAVPTAPAAAAPTASAKPLRAQAQQWSAQKKLSYLQHTVVGDCQRCPLSQHRRHLVFGEGDPEARVMLIGEAPGAQEDREGRPFVGAAGQRLDRWIQASGWSRGQLYIANVLKCRPPHNRDPEPAEIQACRGFLQAQIRAVNPDAIVALGRFAGALVLGRPGLRLYQMRGKDHFYRDPKLPDREILVVVTYHPSFILRKEKELRGGGGPSQEESSVLEDFARARAALNTSAPSS